MSLHLEFPDQYEQCGTCAGTGTVIQTNAYGTPFRKACPKCHSSGYLRRSRVHRDTSALTDEQSLEHEEEGCEDEELSESTPDLLTSHERLRAEIETTQALLEQRLMMTNDLPEDYKLNLWVRLHSVDAQLSESDDALEGLIEEFKSLGMGSFAHELTMLALSYSRLKALQLRLKIRDV